MLANALSNVTSGEVAKSDRTTLPETLRKFRYSNKRLMHIIFPITIALMVASEFLFRVLYNPEFVPAYKVFNIYLLLTCSRLVFPQTIIIGYMRNHVILITSTVTSIINIGLSLLLIKEYGIIGVAIATLVAHYLNKLYLVYFVHKKLNMTPAQYTSWRSLAFYSTILWIVFLLI